MSAGRETPPEPRPGQASQPSPERAPRPSARGARRSSRNPRWVAALAVAVLVAVSAAVVVLLALSGGDSGPGDERAPAAQETPTAAATAPAGGAAASAGSALDEAERDLLAVFGRFQLTDCVPAPREPEGVVAALTCRPGPAADGAGAPQEVGVLRYRDAAALEGDVARRSQPALGSCAAGETNTEVWGFGRERVGRLICRREGDRFDVFWTRDADLVALTATSDDPPGLVGWLRQFNRP